MHPPIASIVIVTYNGARYLAACLDALRPALALGCELIVIDNASRDGGPDLVATRCPEATLVRNAANGGFAAACNQGAALARADTLVFLNQDTQVEPGWIEGLLAGFAQADDIGLTTSKVLLMSQRDRIQICGHDVHYTGLVFSRGVLAPRASMGEPANVGAVSGASFAIRRALWERLGGFDPAFYMYYEETDLSWRARLLGYQSRYVPASVVYHDDRPGQPSANQLYYSFRNRYVLLLKAWRWTTLALLLPTLLLAELIDCALALAYGARGVRAKLRALGWLLLNGGAVLWRRARAQRQRARPDWQILGERCARLSPAVVTGGAPGSALAAVATGCFRANHWAARRVCRAMGV